MNLADTGFVIIASTLVWFMTPGLAFSMVDWFPNAT